MRSQNYKCSPAKADKKYITDYWPPEIADKILWLIENQHVREFDAEHAELLKLLTPKIDIFCFGAMLLYLVNGEKNWTDNTELKSENIGKL